MQITFLRLINVNHHTSRTSSSLVLLFWPAYVLISAVRIRTLYLTGHFASVITHTVDGRITIARESLWLASVAFGLAVFVLELYSPEKQWKSTWGLPWNREGKIRLEDEDEARDTVEGPGGVIYGKNEYGEMESPVVSANVYERLTFSWLTRKSILGLANNSSPVTGHPQVPWGRRHVVSSPNRLCRIPLQPHQPRMGTPAIPRCAREEVETEPQNRHLPSLRQAVLYRWLLERSIRHAQLFAAANSAITAELGVEL